MILNYKPEKLEKLSRDFLIATGVKLAVYDVNFNFLNYKEQNDVRYCSMIQSKEEGKCACTRSDGELLEKCKTSGHAVMHICHAGLLDIALPIMHEKKIIAYLILGQIKTKESNPVINERDLFTKSEISELEAYFRELPVFGQDKIDSILNIAIMVVKYILFENMLIPKYEPMFDRAISFINENLEKDLAIAKISKQTLIRKSSLYKMFHTHLGCTVSEYINSKRIKKASELLINSDMSVAEISEKLGFSTQQYFSKTFKKVMGVSPIQFRKINH
jgi:AraC-like DNA-binding protein